MPGEEPKLEGPEVQQEPAAPSRSGIEWILRNQREYRAGWRLLIYILLTIAAVFILGTLAAALKVPLPPYHMDAIALMMQDVVLGGGAFGIALLMGVFERRSIGIYGLPARQAFGRNFWLGILWGFAMITAIILLIHAFGGFSFGSLALHGDHILHFAALWALTFLVVGFFEEFMFRGYTQFTLTTGIGFWPAAIILSALFGAVHLLNPGEGPVGALSVFVIGMFFCLTLRQTGSLWFAVGLHAAFDWGETFFFSVPDSGIVSPGHLLNSSLHGPAWLSGGTIGPEGSVMTFAVIAAATVLFLLLYRRPDKTYGAAVAVEQEQE